VLAGDSLDCEIKPTGGFEPWYTDNLEAMNLNDLRQYVLTHREDLNAFHLYVDRSKTSGRMITIDPSDPNWKNSLDQKIQQVTSTETKAT
jgi:hypothetical protein